jgi:o-succinylbenzoic acid (OSB) synthetase
VIERAGFRPYDLPLRHGWASARGGFTRRLGWLVWAESEGLTGYGDCAPLPAAGTESHEIAASALKRLISALPGQEIATALAALDVECAATTTPAARFALDCALADLASRRQGLSLRRWLAPEAVDRLAVNTLLGALGQLDRETLVAAQTQGFRVLKLKVGLRSPPEDLEALMTLMPALKAPTTLRLDANGAWSLDQARWFIESLVHTQVPIESIEEPLAEPTPKRLAELQALAPFPLALDESLPTRLATLDPTQLGARRLVLKPAALGGLNRTLALARRAQDAQIEVVVTSLVESAAGLWPTAQLAGAIATPVAHGLATADWLAADLGATPRPRAGWIELPDRPGSGFVPTAPS